MIGWASRMASSRWARVSGTSTPTRPQQRLHLGGAAQIEVAARRRVPEHLPLSLRLDAGGIGGAGGTRTDERRDQPLRLAAVDRQAIGRELDAEELGRGFRAGRRRGCRVVRQRLESRQLAPGRFEGQRGPLAGLIGGRRPPADDPLGPEVPVRIDRFGSRSAVIEVDRREEVVGSLGRQRVQRQPADVGPDPVGLGAPPADQQTMHRREVPAARQSDPVRFQDGRGRVRPQNPTRPQLRVDLAEESGGIGRPGLDTDGSDVVASGGPGPAHGGIDEGKAQAATAVVDHQADQLTAADLQTADHVDDLGAGNGHPDTLPSPGDALALSNSHQFPTLGVTWHPEVGVVGRGGADQISPETASRGRTIA